jgi:lysozyme
MFFGLDVSHHQSPAAVPWDQVASFSKFVIVRLTYGTMRDRQCAEHIRRARAVGLLVGAYHFFRPDQGVQEQIDAFHAAADATGYGERGDIRPALDFEDDTTKRPIVPSDAPNAERAAMGLFQHYGVMPLVYITQRDWGRVGKPAWVLSHRLWVAHYAKPSRAEPATPNGQPFSIWQHRVGPLDPGGPNGYYKPALYDQNRARELPLLNGDTLLARDASSAAPVVEPDDDDETERLRVQAFEAREAGLDIAREATRASAHAQMAIDPNDLQDPDDIPTKPDGRGNA